MLSNKLISHIGKTSQPRLDTTRFFRRIISKAASTFINRLPLSNLTKVVDGGSLTFKSFIEQYCCFLYLDSSILAVWILQKVGPAPCRWMPKLHETFVSKLHDFQSPLCLLKPEGENAARFHCLKLFCISELFTPAIRNIAQYIDDVAIYAPPHHT